MDDGRLTADEGNLTDDCFYEKDLDVITVPVITPIWEGGWQAGHRGLKILAPL